MKRTGRRPIGEIFGHVVPSAVVGGSIGYLISHNLLGSFIGAIGLAFASILIRSTLLALIALPGALALTSLASTYDFLLMGRASSVALALTVSFYFLILIFLRNLINLNEQRSITATSASYLSIVAAVPSLLISAYWARGTNVSALQFLATTGEDNAAWLEGLASGIKDGSGPIVSPGLAFGGGEHLIVPQAILQVLFDFSKSMQLVDNARLLKIEYGILTILFVALTNFMTLALMKSLSATKLVSLITVQSVFSYALISSLISSGHLTAVISTIYLSAAIALSIVYLDSDLNKKSKVLLSLIVAALIYSAGKVWYPLAPATNFILVAFAISSLAIRFRWRQIYTNCLESSSASTLIKLASYCALFLTGALALYAVITMELVTIAKIKAATAPLGLLGATASASAILLIIALLGATWLLRERNYLNNFSKLIVTTLMGYFVVIVLISLIATPGFTIRYAATKLAVVLCALFVPYFLIFVYSHSSRVNNLQALVVSFGLVAVFIFDGSLGQFVNFPLKVDKSVNKTWSAAVVSVGSLQKTPSVVCLNSDDKVRSYEAYLCTRMSIGLFGNYGTYNFAHSTWSGALLGGGEKDFIKDIESDFFNGLTVIAFDGSKISNGDPIQDMWLEEVPWSKVNLIGIG